MNLVTQLFRQFWAHVTATALFALALLRCWRDRSWGDHYVELAVALLGWVAVIAPSEVADWTGNYGWTRKQWRRRPEWFIRAAGFTALAIVAIRIV